MKKKIFITGGSGYMGNHTIPHLRKAGYQVFNFDLKENSQYDIFNKELLLQKMKGFDVVYHLANIPHPFEGNEADYRKLNYEGSILAFQCAAKAKVKKFIFASSGCVYGFWGGFAKPEQIPVSEGNYKPTIAEGQTLYGYFKLAFENYLNKNSAMNNMKSISLRFEGVNPVVVTPPATGMFLAGKKPQEQSFKRWHLLGNCSIENYVQLLTRAIDVDLESYYEVFNVENGIIHPAFDVQTIIKEDYPDIPNYTTGNESLISIEKARRLLGYKPTVPDKFYVVEEEEPVQRPISLSLIREIGFTDFAKRVVKKIIRT